ncbi:M48 family metallopeptidase, partial [Paenibacillus sp. N3.4]
MKITFENHTIEFNVQYGSRKKLSIHIDSAGFISVKAPNNTSKESIMSVVTQHGAVILEKLQAIAKAREIPKTREYQDDGKFLYLGKYYQLHELIETNGLSEDE